jgi:hypothetical protein
VSEPQSIAHNRITSKLGESGIGKTCTVAVASFGTCLPRQTSFEKETG